jgi:uncharacterized membrane protein
MLHAKAARQDVRHVMPQTIALNATNNTIWMEPTTVQLALIIVLNVITALIAECVMLATMLILIFAIFAMSIFQAVLIV